MRNFYTYRLITVIIAFILLPTLLFSQNREPQNIYRVTVNSRYVLEDGKRTRKFFAIHQEISDSLGRMHTEIDYDWETRHPNNYRWHYFDGQTKVKTDFFEDEKLRRIHEFKYQDDGKLSELEVYRVTESDTSLQVREEYTYNSDGLLTRVNGYNKKDRRGFRARYKYDEQGNEVKRRVWGRRAIPSDSIRKLDRTLSYDSLNRIAYETVTVDKVDQPEETRSYKYSYNEDGDVLEKSIYNRNKELLRREEFVYRSRDNRLQQKIVYDANGNLIDHLAWRYEIYKTSDRRRRVLE
ncbi:MAG: hypothetical protein ACLFNU_10650 [Bacteroidales bacterium]